MALNITMAIYEGKTIAKGEAKGKIVAKPNAQDKVTAEVLGQFDVKNFDGSIFLAVEAFDLISKLRARPDGAAS